MAIKDLMYILIQYLVCLLILAGCLHCGSGGTTGTANEAAISCRELKEWTWKEATPILSTAASPPTTSNGVFSAYIPNSLPWRTGSGYSYEQIQPSIDFTREPNSKSIKAQIDPLNPASSFGPNYRSEITLYPWHDPIPLKTERWIGWSYYFPSNFINDTTSDMTIFQYHVGQGSPAVELWCNSNRSGEVMLSARIEYSPVPSKHVYSGFTIPPGAWTDFVIHIIGDTEAGGSGLIELWINGQKVGSIVGGNTYSAPSDGNPPYCGTPKLGLYKHPWLWDHESYAGVTASASIGITKLEVYIGPVRIITRVVGDYTGDSGYNCVAPKGLRPVTTKN